MQFVIIQECSAGNESVGSEWMEVATFPSTATLADVWKWRESYVHHGLGRTMIRPDTRATDRETEMQDE